jgi:hypothetical protein
VTDLDAALRDLAPHVAFPDPPDVAAAVRMRLAGTPAPARRSGAVGWRRPDTRQLLTLAAVVLAVVIAVAAAVPRARHAVADRLGLRGVEVRVSPTTGVPPTSAILPTGLDLGRATTLAEAAAGFAAPLLVPPDAPTGVFVDDRTGEVSLTLADARLLSQFPNAVPLFEKVLNIGDEARAVTVAGGRGLWLPGAAHVFIELGDDVVDATSRLAGPTLIWEHGDATLRLEGVPTLEAALAIAESLRPYS